MTVESSGAVWAEYHQFLLAAGDVPQEWDGQASNGLIEPTSGGGAIVLCGVSGGTIAFRASASLTRPEPDLAGWDDVVEVTVAAPTGDLHVEGWGAMSVDTVNLALAGAGAYRVRCSARDRDKQRDEFSDPATERFQLEVWPAADATLPGEALRDSGFFRMPHGSSRPR